MTTQDERNKWRHAFAAMPTDQLAGTARRLSALARTAADVMAERGAEPLRPGPMPALRGGASGGLALADPPARPTLRLFAGGPTGPDFGGAA